MRYREYKGYTLIKDYVINEYSICKDGKALHYGTCKQFFGKLKDAKSFIDRMENNEITNSAYRWV